MASDGADPRGGAALLGRRAVAARLTSLVDQVFFSAVSFLQIAIYSRLFDKAEFGAFSLALGVAMVLYGIQRSALIVPLIVLFPLPDDFRKSRHWERAHFAFVAAIGLALVAASAVAFRLARPDFGGLFALSALLGAGLLLLDYQRRALYQLQKSRAALIVSSVYLALSVVGFVPVALWARNAAGAAAAASLAALLAALVARVSRGPFGPSAPSGRPLREVRATIGWTGLSFLPYTIYNNGMVLIVGALAGPVTAAIFAATRAFAAPIQLLTSAIDNTDKPRASRALAADGAKGLGASLRNTAATLLLLAAPYLAAIFFAPGFVGHLLLGGRYADDMWLARLWAVFSVFLLLGQPLETGLVLAGRSDWLVACRTVAALLCFAGAVLLMPHYGAAGAVVAMVVGWGIGSALCWVGLRLVLRAMG